MPSNSTARSSAPYTSRIIKAGALIGDTKTLLSHWDLDTSVDENLSRVRRENIFGKASRSRVEDILGIFRQRYLSEASVTKALVTLVRSKFPTAALEKLFYFHSAKNDRLLHDTVTEILLPIQEQGLAHVTVQDLRRSLTKWIEEGKTKGQWSASTVTHAVQGLMSTLRDFGVLQGAVNKKIAPGYLPIESFSYIVFYLRQHQQSGVRLIELPEWNLFFMRREAVERFLFETRQKNSWVSSGSGSLASE